MPPVSIDDGQWDNAKNMAMIAKVAAVQTSLLVNSYGYHDIARLISMKDQCEDEDEDEEEEEDDDDDRTEVEETDDEDDCCEGKYLVAQSDDPLAEVLVNSLEALESTVREGPNELYISPALSVGELFQKGNKGARDLKPRLLLVFDLTSDDAACVGALTACKWTLRDDLLTSRFTNQYITRHKLPRNLSSYLFIDVISASKPPSGLLMMLTLAVYAARSKYAGIAMVAVSKKGIALGRNFGCESHAYREDGAARQLMHIALADISVAHVNRKLRIGSANNKVLTQLCARHGLGKTNAQKIYTRC